MRSLIVLALCICGCASTQQTSAKQLLVVIDNSFDVYQIEKIQRALDYWERQADLNLKVEVQDVSGDRVRWSYD
jgi:hypothetical protein